MIKINYSTSSVSTLVGDRVEFHKAYQLIFMTISPNPKMKIDTILHGKKQKVPYGQLPQRVQYYYCISFIRKSVFPFLFNEFKYVGTAELNTSGNIHFHLLIFDPSIQTVLQLKLFQRDISMTEQSIRNRRKLIDKDYMNNIVFLTKPLSEIIEYMDKDYTDKKEIFLQIHSD